jgi:pimeloyl-ACP methyl ester carboxylesterase
MSQTKATTGFAPIDNARIYYEVAGSGQPFVMIHAGVADHRQWNNEFSHFADRYRVVRYDQRGFGRSEPVEGEYSYLADLTALVHHLELEQPLILMGCSMGGGTAMDYALANPGGVSALIMVGSGPGGLELDVPSSPKFADVEKAFLAGDLDLTAELETQIWFDGTGRSPEQVDPAMRRLAYEMNRGALAHEVKKLGTKRANSLPPAAGRLGELQMPVLIVVGTQDESYILGAADVMLEAIPQASKVVVEDAAHLVNMDHPAQFQRIVTEFLERLEGSSKDTNL